MIVSMGKNGSVPLPDGVCDASKLDIGDILLCTVMKDQRSIQLEKFEDQTLSDEQIEAHGLLTRVVVLNPTDFD